MDMRNINRRNVTQARMNFRMGVNRKDPIKSWNLKKYTLMNRIIGGGGGGHTKVNLCYMVITRRTMTKPFDRQRFSAIQLFQKKEWSLTFTDAI